MTSPRLLLVNPWITDGAAFDLWAWPIGLLYWAERLRGWGCEVGLVDCTDRHHPGLQPYGTHHRAFGTGKYHAERILPPPEPARRAERPFRRYGYPLDFFQAELRAIETRWDGPPDAILVSSRMTYWYPGVQLAIRLLREQWPDRSIPILLGGIYATLCPEHARAYSGADKVFEGDAFDSLPPGCASVSLKGLRRSPHPTPTPRRGPDRPSTCVTATTLFPCSLPSGVRTTVPIVRRRNSRLSIGAVRPIPSFKNCATTRPGGEPLTLPSTMTRF
jgi:hypothetical protein